MSPTAVFLIVTTAYAFPAATAHSVSITRTDSVSQCVGLAEKLKKQILNTESFRLNGVKFSCEEL